VDDIEDQRFENLMIVSPDIGGVVRARAVAKSWAWISGSSTNAVRKPITPK
jgi:phosphoribosylpyrophosphate synthetase